MARGHRRNSLRALYEQRKDLPSLLRICTSTSQFVTEVELFEFMKGQIDTLTYEGTAQCNTDPDMDLQDAFRIVDRILQRTATVIIANAGTHTNLAQSRVEQAVRSAWSRLPEAAGQELARSIKGQNWTTMLEMAFPTAIEIGSDFDSNSVYSAMSLDEETPEFGSKNPGDSDSDSDSADNNSPESEDEYMPYAVVSTSWADLTDEFEDEWEEASQKFEQSYARIATSERILTAEEAEDIREAALSQEQDDKTASDNAGDLDEYACDTDIVDHIRPIIYSHYRTGKTVAEIGQSIRECLDELSIRIKRDRLKRLSTEDIEMLVIGILDEVGWWTHQLLLHPRIALIKQYDL